MQLLDFLESLSPPLLFVATLLCGLIVRCVYCRFGAVDVARPNGGGKSSDGDEHRDAENKAGD